MVDFGTPYAIDGTRIPAEGLRRQSQRDAGAGSGVARPGDLKVTQMNTPGTGVRIAAGDDIIQCRAPGRDRESYSTPNLLAQDWMGDAGTGIPGTGSSATRRDMIIHEILDPSLPRHYTPQAQWPAGALSKISVVPGVAASAKSVKDVPALNDVTCYELAAINWPASTATITNAMIEDLRAVHSPRQLYDLRTLELSGAQEIITSTAVHPAGGQTWPLQAEDAGELLFYIPEWATHARIDVTIYGAIYPGGNANGKLWLRIGANTGFYVSTRPTSWDAENIPGFSRATLGFADTVALPEVLRGTRQQFRPRAMRSVGTNATSAALDSASSLALRVMFQELTV